MQITKLTNLQKENNMMCPDNYIDEDSAFLNDFIRLKLLKLNEKVLKDIVRIDENQFESYAQVKELNKTVGGIVGSYKMIINYYKDLSEEDGNAITYQQNKVTLQICKDNNLVVEC